MISYKWNFLELFASENQLISVRYLLSADDGQNIAESEGSLIFKPETANKSLADIVESDLVQWAEKDTTVDDVNLIKSNLEDQLKNLAIKQTLAVSKVDFPWLAGTFTIG